MARKNFFRLSDRSQDANYYHLDQLDLHGELKSRNFMEEEHPPEYKKMRGFTCEVVDEAGNWYLMVKPCTNPVMVYSMRSIYWTICKYEKWLDENNKSSKQRGMWGGGGFGYSHSAPSGVQFQGGIFTIAMRDQKVKQMILDEFNQ